jgi:hypothetical protein
MMASPASMMAGSPGMLSYASILATTSMRWPGCVRRSCASMYERTLLRMLASRTNDIATKSTCAHEHVRCYRHQTHACPGTHAMPPGGAAHMHAPARMRRHHATRACDANTLRTHAAPPAPPHACNATTALRGAHPRGAHCVAPQLPHACQREPGPVATHASLPRIASHVQVQACWFALCARAAWHSLTDSSARVAGTTLYKQQDAHTARAERRAQAGSMPCWRQQSRCPASPWQ